MLLTGEVSTKERYGTCVCYEDITQSRHAGERTGWLFAICTCFYCLESVSVCQ